MFDVIIKKLSILKKKNSCFTRSMGNFRLQWFLPHHLAFACRKDLGMENVR